MWFSTICPYSKPYGKISLLKINLIPLMVGIFFKPCLHRANLNYNAFPVDHNLSPTKPKMGYCWPFALCKMSNGHFYRFWESSHFPAEGFFFKPYIAGGNEKFDLNLRFFVLSNFTLKINQMIFSTVLPLLTPMQKCQKLKRACTSKIPRTLDNHKKRKLSAVPLEGRSKKTCKVINNS